MKKSQQFGLVLSVTAALTLGACSSSPNSNPYASGSGSEIQNQPRSEYGVVHSIEYVKQEQEKGGIGGSGYGLGTVAGAVVGGVVGNQVGGGSGKAIATVAGVAGGAYVGHKIEERNRQQEEVADEYRLSIRMSDGSYRTLTQSTDTHFVVGDGVRIENGIAYRY